ncbi:MAG: hypothetical protein JNK89_05295, partial [Saprospiraceae bacterium]|nr:hypothetical protein [Saprospiraceae bacterium]
MNPRRYPGIRPFETAESHLFFGRDRDVHDLHVLASLEKLVVLFGKSGYGKSSLINAGLLPLLAGQERPDADRPLPVMVRFGSFSAGANRTPVDMLLGRLQEILPHEGPHFLDDLAPERPLWYHFKKRQHTSSNTPSASKNR